MFEKDTHVINHALTMWSNYIETGDVTRSRHDLRKDERARALTDDQQLFCIRLRKLANEQLNRDTAQ
jgi:hypothetical protein